MKTIRSTRHHYEAMNTAAAEAILSDPDRYGGRQGFPVCWATLYLERIGNIAPKAQEQASASANTAEERTENA